MPLVNEPISSVPKPADRTYQRSPFAVRQPLLLGVAGLALLLGAAALALLVMPEASGEYWTVASDGSGNYRNLTAALADVDYVQSGDTLWVEPGQYLEAVTLNRSLTIVGQGPPGSVVVNGGGAGDTFLIEADNVTLANLTVKGSRNEWPFAAVHVREVADFVLETLTLTESQTGLYLEGSRNATVAGFYAFNNSNGAWLLGAEGTYFERARFEENANYGLVLQGARQTRYEQVVSVGQPQDLRSLGAHTHDVAYNSTFGSVLFLESSGSLRHYNSLQLQVADHLGQPLAGVELNLTAEGRSLYATPAFNGSALTSDARGTFPELLVEVANYSTASSLQQRIMAQVVTSMGWQNQTHLNLSRPLNMTLIQPDLPPVVANLAPQNSTLQPANVTLEWAGHDPEGLNLTYTLAWQVAGDPWRELALGANTSAVVEGLQPGANVTWRVSAFDGNLTVLGQPTTFTVNVPPTVGLLSPAAGHRFPRGPPQLSWQGNDSEAGEAGLTFTLYYGTTDWPTTLAAQGVGLTFYNLTRVANGGNYTWRVVVDDGVEQVSSPVRHFTLNGPPRARIETAEPLLAAWPANITLKGYGLDEGAIVGHQWRVVGLGLVAETAVTVLDNLSYGAHQIEYRVLDEEGLWSAWEHVVVRLYTLPVAEAGPDVQMKVGESVFFDASASSDLDGRIVRWEWDFDGDGTIDWSSEATPLITHTYYAARPYQAVLKVTDDDGYTATDARLIEIIRPESDSGTGSRAGQPGLTAVQAVVLVALVALALRVGSEARGRFK